VTNGRDNSGKGHGRDRKGGWRKGQSGNPEGCPQGSRHRATKAAEALLDDEAEALTRKAVEMALEGDGIALRLCLERILPARKERPPVTVALPALKGVDGLAEITGALLEATASGEVTPGEAAELGKLVEGHRKALELVDLEARIAALEERSR
jgi:hypothetical protein